MITENLKKIVIEPSSGQARSCVIWLHGLGANGHDFVDIIPELALPTNHNIRFIFPHAPKRAVTLNNGFIMPAWYDIFGLSASSQEDAPGIQDAYQILSGLIDEQYQGGIAYNRIVLVGFSQGGALALYTATQFPQPLAGVAGLSTYLPLQETIPNNRFENAVPVFMAHGLSDRIVSLELGEKSRARLQNLGYDVQWHTYPMLHTVCKEELVSLGQWMSELV